MLVKMDMATGFRKLDGMARLYVTTGQFGEQILCKPADSLADCVALGGIMLRPDKTNAPGDFVVYLGSDMHALLRRTDPRALMTKSTSVSFSTSKALSSVAATVAQQATIKHQGIVIDGFSGDWEYCAVISKASSGYGASGGASWIACMDLVLADVPAAGKTIKLNTLKDTYNAATGLATYQQLRAITAARKTNQANVFIGQNCTPVDYFLAGLVKMPWYENSYLTLRKVWEQQLAECDEGKEFMVQAWNEWLPKQQARAAFLNVPFFLRANASGSLWHFSREVGSSVFATVPKQINSENVQLITSCFAFCPGQTFTAIEQAKWGTTWPTEAAQVIASPTANHSTSFDMGTLPVLYEHGFGDFIPADGLTFPLVMSTTFINANASINLPGWSMARPAVASGPVRRIGPIEIGGWFAPAVPLAYYSSTDGTRNSSLGVDLPIESFISATGGRVLKEVTIEDSAATDVLRGELVVGTKAPERIPDDIVYLITRDLDALYDLAEDKASN